MNWNDREIRLKIAASTASEQRKHALREKLENDIQQFLRRGGEITRLPPVGSHLGNSLL